jgi:hypothetical protein
MDGRICLGSQRSRLLCGKSEALSSRTTRIAVCSAYVVVASRISRRAVFSGDELAPGFIASARDTARGSLKRDYP